MTIGNVRVWLFRSLLVVAAGLMLLSWLIPWWSCDIVVIEMTAFADAAIIHPYGLEANLGGYNIYIPGSEMPTWFAPLMWTYLGICVGLLLFSFFVNEKELNLGRFRLSLPKMIIGGVGLSYIVVAILAVIVAAIRTGDFWGIHLIGFSEFVDPLTDVSGDVWAQLRLGYWLACGVGPFLIVLALLRDRITGKAKLKC